MTCTLLKYKNIIWARGHMPIVPATWQAKAEGSLKPRSSRPAWATKWDLRISMAKRQQLYTKAPHLMLAWLDEESGRASNPNWWEATLTVTTTGTDLPLTGTVSGLVQKNSNNLGGRLYSLMKSSDLGVCSLHFPIKSRPEHFVGLQYRHIKKF